MPTPVIQNSGGGLNDFANLIKTLSGEFGSGKTKEDQKMSVDPAVNAQADQLLQQIAGSANPADIDAMIQSILSRAKQAFGPAAIGANAAGIRAYSDTTEAALRDEAIARATGEAAQAKLAAINTANATAAKVVDSKMANNRQVQTQRKTGATPTGMGLLLSLGAGAVAKRLPKGLFGDSEAGDTGLTKSSYSPGEFGPENVANFPGDVGQTSNAMDVGEPESVFVGDLPTIFDNPDIPDSSQVFDGESAASDITEGSGDAVTDAAIGVDEGIENSIGEGVVGGGGEDLFTDFFGGFFADGGVVSGQRAAPGAYAPGVLDSPTTKPSSSLAPSATIAGPATAPKTTTQPRKTITIDQDGNLVNGAAGVADANTSPGMSFGGFSPSSVAVAAANVAGGNFPAAAMALMISAFVNGKTDPVVEPNTELLPPTEEEINQTELIAPPAEAPQTGFTEAGFDAAMTAADADAVSGTADASAPAASDAGTSTGAGDGGADSGGGDSGGGDGSSEADGGVIQGNDAQDYSGIDKVLIHVTPGEAVLPVDTVNALGGLDAIEELIKKTHRPIRRRR